MREQLHGGPADGDEVDCHAAAQLTYPVPARKAVHYAGPDGRHRRIGMKPHDLLMALYVRDDCGRLAFARMLE